ncbi:MAG: serine hydrolase [Bacteroidetes bacterium]|nr:serine hydrolase [Bacteroidota bacterium]
MRAAFTLLAFVFLFSCLKEDPLNKPFESYVPIEIGDGLVISTPLEEGMNPEKLTSIYSDAYADENLWSMRSLLVFRNGRLVSESYFKDDNDLMNHHLIWSSTKQVMGILSGIALEHNLIASLDDPISTYLPSIPEKYPEKSGITIRHLITMLSGNDYNNDGVSGQTDKVLRQIPDNITEYVLSRPMRADPGEEFFYNDGDPQLMSAILQNAAGKPTDEWADEVLFSRIGVTNYNWVRYKDGTTLGGFGIETTPRELGKIALCVADSGSFSGEQVIPRDWIARMTSPQVDLDADFDFGYYWWLDRVRGIHFTWGHGGQFAFIVPDQSLVVVITSIPNTQGDYQIQADEALPYVDKIIESCN